MDRYKSNAIWEGKQRAVNCWRLSSKASIFSKSLSSDERPVRAGGNLVPDGFTDTTGHTRPALISCRKVPAEPGRARGRSFKRKRALGERAWNGQTLAASSTGQQLRQGSQLGQKGQRWAIEGRLGMPRPAPPHALRPCSFSSPNTCTPGKPLKSKCCIFGPFL